ncbi:6-phosphogluconolactonase [Liquorilactobacillus oeni DSM 19972]|uniref:6-phosphogluconolactonase n=1 Tax=Liquorilactobacillus oeni DSM 19972 TaxID=1423777 RepID=A0A0R1M9Q8_9LACO|nr:6-phosphogluconolactonase [Liquorilactobacillus oeni DSM 19972]
MNSLKQTLFFGTYTKKSSVGIYRSELDTQKAHLSLPSAFIQIENPTYLQTTSTGNLYTVSKKGKKGGVAGFSFGSNNASPQFVSEVLTTGAPPCYVGWDHERKMVYTANFHKGTLNIFKTLDGKLVQLKEIKYTGHGPRKEQDQARIHYADLTPDRRLIVCDLGSDCVYLYDFTDTKLKLASTYKTEPGFAPRHIVFHPNQKFAFLVGELSNQVSVLEYDKKSGCLRHKSTLSTLPSQWQGQNGAAAVRISKDGNFLYVSNRGHNSIAIFSIAPDGTLKQIGFTPVQGEFPRDFALDPTDHFLVVVNQKTNNATLFERSLKTGQLICKQKDIPVPEGVCVSFSKF